MILCRPVLGDLSGVAYQKQKWDRSRAFQGLCRGLQGPGASRSALSELSRASQAPPIRPPDQSRPPAVIRHSKRPAFQQDPRPRNLSGASSQSPFGCPTRAQGLFGLAMMLRQPCLPRPYLAFESWARYPLALLEPLLVHMTSYVECLTGNKSSYKLHHPSIQQVSWRVERPRDHGRLC